MPHSYIISFTVIALVVLTVVIRRSNPERKYQKALENYLNRSLSNSEIGLFYERYIGHLYEIEGYDVTYNGAVQGFGDMGRDLIVKNVHETLIVQAKYWAKNKTIQEKHVFQLFGTMTHYKRTCTNSHGHVRALLITTASFSEVAKDAAKVLGVELRVEPMNRSYPMIKCKITSNGKKVYHLPFDPDYDKLKVDLHKDECFARTIREAMNSGFDRAS